MRRPLEQRYLKRRGLIASLREDQRVFDTFLNINFCSPLQEWRSNKAHHKELYVKNMFWTKSRIIQFFSTLPTESLETKLRLFMYRAVYKWTIFAIFNPNVVTAHIWGTILTVTAKFSYVINFIYCIYNFISKIWLIRRVWFSISINLRNDSFKTISIGFSFGSIS